MPKLNEKLLATLDADERLVLTAYREYATDAEQVAFFTLAKSITERAKLLGCVRRKNDSRKSV